MLGTGDVSGTYGDLTYEIYYDMGDAVITGCSKSAVSVDIPEEIEGYPVTEIYIAAFKDCTELVKVTMPATIRRIEQYAFENCTSLTDITLTDSVNFISYRAFYGCSSLKNLTIPETVTYIGDNAFTDCTSLESINIPNRVQSIGAEAFKGCSSLSTVSIGTGKTSLTSIGWSAFDGCMSLTEFTVPANVTSLGQYAFYDCSSLKSVTINGKLNEIKDYVFNCCTNLESVNIPETVTSIGLRSFFRCSSLKNITIPESVTSINDFAFENCSSLCSIRVPEAVTVIEPYTFADCSGLENVTLGNQTTEIGDNAFYRCESMTSINLPDGLHTIGDNAFAGCERLTDLQIPSSVSAIGDAAFSWCYSLQGTFVIPDGITAITDSMFSSCKNLTGIQIPASVTSIGDGAFYNCLKLETIAIPEGVPEIKPSTFRDCELLNNIRLPQSLNAVGLMAFLNCTNLTTVYYSGTRDQWKQITIDDYNEPLLNANIICVSVPVTGVSLNKTELNMKKGETEALTASVIPGNADEKSVTWTSSNEAVASVDANGKVTAVKSGTAIITVKTNDGGYTAKCTVTVTTPVTGVSLDRTALTLFEEDSAVLTAAVSPADADDKHVVWSSSDEAIAAVDNNGKVTAIKAGTAVIKVSTADGSFTAECNVTVREKGSVIFVTRVELNKTELTLRVGKSETLIATVLPEDAEDKSVTWSSSDPSVATVDQNGKVTAVADTGIGNPASAVITVTTNDGSYTASCTVAVEDPINGFVRRLYKLCFNRTADPGGFRQWTTGLRTKKNTAAATVRFFFTSQEFKNLKLNDDAFVEMCYQVMMDRASDAGGKKNWVSKLDIGMSQTYVLRGFIASREFSKICADYGITVGSISLTEPRDKNQGITEFVSRCYSEVLGRKADTGGLNDWCNRILTASSRKQAAINAASNGFFHSEEYMNKHTSNDQYVRTLYRTFLGREADQGGYNDWMNKLRTGTSRDSVMKGFANSTEFANIMAKYGIK